MAPIMPSAGGISDRQFAIGVVGGNRGTRQRSRVRDFGHCGARARFGVRAIADFRSHAQDPIDPETLLSARLRIDTKADTPSRC
jgi:hypothetical protein